MEKVGEGFGESEEMLKFCRQEIRIIKYKK